MTRSETLVSESVIPVALGDDQNNDTLNVSLQNDLRLESGRARNLQIEARSTVEKLE